MIRTGMDTFPLSALLLILGPTLAAIGFGAFPTRIYTSRDVQEKTNLLAAMPLRWFLCQVFVILGGTTIVAGSIYLIQFFLGSPGAPLAWIAAACYLFGHVFWIWHLGWRAIQPQMFARNELPGWLFQAFSILILFALASLGIAFWLQGTYQVLGAGIFTGAIIVLIAYILMKDMPPFIYYTMTLIIGLTLEL
jgi:hypothetical protein